ncbi:exopolysaccharide production protein ExoZ [Gammaproteobacteria bacterium]
MITYFPYVDGLRAIAILSVVIYHLNPAWLPGGFSGVDIFFVISGFIVSASVSSLDRVGLLKFMPFFYARRFQRIGPALIICLLATALVTALLIPAAWLSGSIQETGLYAFFGLSNFMLVKTSNDYFSPIAEFNPYTHTWSLGVEEQFYFLFPLLFFTWSFRPWRRVTTGLFVVALVASLGYSAWLGQTDKISAFYMIASRFWQLAAGVLLFQIMTLLGRRFDTSEQPSPGWFTAGALFSLWLIGYGFAVSKPERYPFPGAIPSVLGTLGVLGFLHGQRAENPVMRCLVNRPIVFIGKISYSLYLWHWPVLVLFRWTVRSEEHTSELQSHLLISRMPSSA